MSESEPEYVFDQAQIGKGLRPLAQHGFVVIDSGVLTLLGSNRQTIASAPLMAVSAKKVPLTRRQTLSLTMAGEKFNVSPGWGVHERLGPRVGPGRPRFRVSDRKVPEGSRGSADRQASGLRAGR